MQAHYNRDSVKRNSRNSVPIYSSGLIVGIVEDGVFRKNITGSRHLLRKPLAIAVSNDALLQAENFGATRIVVFDRETQATYCSLIAHLRERGFEFDRGYGKQIALPLGEWASRKPGDVMQLGLFKD